MRTRSILSCCLLILAACRGGGDEHSGSPDSLKTIHQDSLERVEANRHGAAVRGAAVRGTGDTTREPRASQLAADELAGNFSVQYFISFDSSVIDLFFRRYRAAPSRKKEVKLFYTGRRNSFAWYDSNGLSEQAGNLYNRLKNLPEEGLATEIPFTKSLDSLMETPDSKDPGHRIETELLLTTMYFYFAEKVWTGLNEQETKKIEWYLPRKNTDYGAWLGSYLQSPAMDMKGYEPVYRQYVLLRSFLKRYVALEREGKWKPFRLPEKSYRLGDSATILVAIKRRLYELGDLTVNETNALFDADLDRAVRGFQHRFGLKEDGIIGNNMIVELNRPVGERIRQEIIVNMERSRWLQESVKGGYIVVNIPEFKLNMNLDDSLLWEMNVVVGKELHKTVIFSGDIKYVVFNPYWNVPASILKAEVLPGIRKNSNYLAQHNMEWQGNGVRQKPGPWNSLGKVKFLFPNRFNIYLHDTPAKDLFKENTRAFSHGCIRLGDPVKLALYLLRTDPKWTKEAVAGTLDNGKEQYVSLKQGLPVFITYFTSWVDRAGKLNFRRDIYNRDRRLEAMIRKN